MQVPSYFQPYVDLVPEKNVLEALKSSSDVLHEMVREIREDQGEFAYADGKWTIKDMIQHIIDSERVFTYRALTIARGDKTELPGFEHNDYVKTALGNKRSFFSLMDEFSAVRQSTLALYKSISPIHMQEKGIANGAEISPEALGFIISGHTLHHMKVLEERYLPLL